MSTWPANIGLIGCGAMGSAMVHGLHRAGHAQFVLADAIDAAAAALAGDVAGRVGTIADIGGCDVALVAVKPKDAADVLAQLGPHLGADTVVVSVVAGWDLARLRAALGGRGAVRTMPNLAVRDGLGLIAISADGIAVERVAQVAALLQPLGTVEELPEHQFSAATALAGSGPGFVALVAEGLEEGAVGAGFSRPQARRMVQAVLAGTAALLSDQGEPAELRRRVSSPGGTTVAGVAVLERGAVRDHIAEAVRAAANRAQEL